MHLMTESRPSTTFTLRLPQCFPTMTAQDHLIVHKWCIKEGDMIQADPEKPERDMLEVIAPYGEIWISIPPFLRKAHRVVRLLKPENTLIKLGDPFIELQPLENA